VFGADKILFLGHMVGGNRVRPLADKDSAVTESKPPTCVKELQAFLGIINFYRRYLPGKATTLVLLTDALNGGGKGATPIACPAQ
jgi:hypothetical protein